MPPAEQEPDHPPPPADDLRPRHGVSSASSVESEEMPRPSGCQSLAQRLPAATCSRAALRLPAPPDEPPHRLDDDKRDEPAEQDVGEIMAAEGESEQARAGPESEGRDDRGNAPGRGQDARRRDHPEPGRRFAGDERTVPLARAVRLVPRHEWVLAAEIPGLVRPRPAPIAIVAMRKITARPLGAQRSFTPERLASQSAA